MVKILSDVQLDAATDDLTVDGTVVATGGDSETNTDTASINAIGYNQRGGVGYHGFLDVKNTYGSATNPKKFFRLNSSGAIEIINNAYTTNLFTLSDAGNLTVPSLTANTSVTADHFNGSSAYSSGVSASSIAVGSVGITPLATGISTTVTPDFVGQRFLVGYHGSSTTNTSTVQYLIHSITDTAGNRLVENRNFSNGSGVTFTNGFFCQAVWVADSLSAKTFQGRVRMQSSTGITVTIFSYGMMFIPFP